MDQLIAMQQEHKVTEEQRIKKAVAEQDAKHAQQQREEEDKKAEMLKSIAAYRESLVTQMLPRQMCRKMRSHFKVFLVVCVGTFFFFLTETRKGAEGQNGQTTHTRHP